MVHDYWSGFGRGLQAHRFPELPGSNAVRIRDIRVEISSVNESIYVFEVFFVRPKK